MDMDMDIDSVIWDGGWVFCFVFFRAYFFIYIYVWYMCVSTEIIVIALSKDKKVLFLQGGERADEHKCYVRFI